jgi:predicted nuclease of predicted toxin-antitoxin system
LQLFIDECLSPKVALELIEIGHYAVHPRNQGGMGEPDHAVLARATRENLVIVTENVKDFRALVAREEIHPEIIIIPCTSHERSKAYLLSAIEYLTEQGDPDDVMVNHVFEVEEVGQGEITMRLYPLPTP